LFTPVCLCHQAVPAKGR